MFINRSLPVLMLILFAGSNLNTALAHEEEARDFVIMKTPYRHLIASPLPTTELGDVDIEMLFVEASMTEEPNLSPKMKWHLFGVISALIEEDVYSAERYMERFVRSTKNTRTPMDINAVIRWTMRQSYLETNRELSYFANKVKYFNDLKKTLRDEQLEVERLRGLEGCVPGGPPGDICSDSGALLVALDSQLLDIGDDGQLANLDLQSALQQQQQSLSVVSNMAKLIYDTTMSIIRNIGGGGDDD